MPNASLPHTNRALRRQKLVRCISTRRYPDRASA